MTFITRPSVSLPTGTETGSAQADGLHAAHQAFGGLQRDGAHAAFADVLGDLGDDVHRRGRVEAFAGDPDGRVDHRDLAFGELNVDGGARHLNDFAFY